MTDPHPKMELMEPGAAVHCEKCPWSGVERECYTLELGCVCPACGSAFSVTEGFRPPFTGWLMATKLVAA